MANYICKLDAGNGFFDFCMVSARSLEELFWELDEFTDDPYGYEIYKIPSYIPIMVSIAYKQPEHEDEDWELIGKSGDSDINGFCEKFWEQVYDADKGKYGGWKMFTGCLENIELIPVDKGDYT